MQVCEIAPVATNHNKRDVASRAVKRHPASGPMPVEKGKNERNEKRFFGLRLKNQWWRDIIW